MGSDEKLSGYFQGDKHIPHRQCLEFIYKRFIAEGEHLNKAETARWQLIALDAVEDASQLIGPLSYRQASLLLSVLRQKMGEAATH